MDKDVIELMESTLVGQKLMTSPGPMGVTQFKFENINLVVWSSWRVHSNGKIIAASGSDDPQFEDLKARLVGKIVKSISVSPPFYDLQIVFATGEILDTFQEADRYEHWNFVWLNEQAKLIVAGIQDSWACFGI